VAGQASFNKESLNAGFLLNRRRLKISFYHFLLALILLLTTSLALIHHKFSLLMDKNHALIAGFHCYSGSDSFPQNPPTYFPRCLSTQPLLNKAQTLFRYLLETSNQRYPAVPVCCRLLFSADGFCAL
jgi:hypothetical protein